MSRIQHRIKIDEEMLNESWEQMWAEIYLLHHIYPTKISKQNVSPEDAQLMAEYSSMAYHMGIDAGYGK